MTQVQLAGLTGLKSSNLSAIERGIANPMLDEFGALATALDIGGDRLLLLAESVQDATFDLVGEWRTGVDRRAELPWRLPRRKQEIVVRSRDEATFRARGDIPV